MRSALFIPFSSFTPAENMAIDSAFLRLAQEGTFALRFYSWTPDTFSLGRFQAINSEDLRRDLMRLGVPVIRRVTGGGAIWHSNELTYALALPVDVVSEFGGSDAVYAQVHRAIVSAICGQLSLSPSQFWMPIERDASFQSFGEDRLMCFSRRSLFDVLASDNLFNFSNMNVSPFNAFLGVQGELGNRKLVGSAQRRRSGAILQHGSIKIHAGHLMNFAAGFYDVKGARMDSLDVAFLGTRVLELLGARPLEVAPPADTLIEPEALAHFRSDKWLWGGRTMKNRPGFSRK